MFTKLEGRQMCALAFYTITTHFSLEERFLSADWPWTKKKYPLFVTWKKAGVLRGCIGTFDADKPLKELVPEYARRAAFQDGRFQPIVESEIKDLSVSVSLLTNFELAKTPEDWEIGKHGITVRLDGKSATYLPEVAVEQRWSKEETMKNLLQKAGIAKEWNSKDLEVERYQSFVSEIGYLEYSQKEWFPNWQEWSSSSGVMKSNE